MPTSEKVRSLQGRRAAARRYGHPTDDLDRDYAAERLAAYVEKVLSDAPPLTDEQRAAITRLLSGGERIAG